MGMARQYPQSQLNTILILRPKFFKKNVCLPFSIYQAIFLPITFCASELNFLSFSSPTAQNALYLTLVKMIKSVPFSDTLWLKNNRQNLRYQDKSYF